MNLAKEKVIIAVIYLQNGSIGLKYMGEGNMYEVKYFLESYLKVERQKYENSFHDTNINNLGDKK
jgi:hypothetical protein